MNILQIDHLKKRFGKQEVVKGVSFEVKKGEIFGFLGHNGAGKSTTINMIVGVMPISEGRIQILGEPISRLDKVKPKMGVMPDASNFYDDMNALDHVAYYADIKGLRVGKEELLQLLVKVGLSGSEMAKVGTYSFGMKKKLSLAQALLGGPELLFLDEPTSGVDPESAVQIQNIIKEINKEGTTVFLTSHNMTEVEKMCERVAIMNKGEIVRYGEIKKLKAQQAGQKKVKIRVGEEDTDYLSSKLHMFEGCDNVRTEGSVIYLEVEDEEQIPVLVTSLIAEGFSIYEVAHKEVSLEEVFFEAGEKKNVLEHL